MKKAIGRVGIVAVGTALGLALAVNLAPAENHEGRKGPPLVAPPNSMAFGKSLAEWSSIFWRWNYEGADMSQSLIEKMQMMPIPAPGDPVSGTGTPADPFLFRGKVEITLAPGTPFVLPEFAWIGERYKGHPTVPDDLPFANDTLLRDVHPWLTIDGNLVMSDANKAAFYIPPTLFEPIVVYPKPTSYDSVAAVFFQGCAVVGLPLSPGVHVIKLYEPYIIHPGDYAALPDGFGQIYDNTWIVTVKRPAHIAPITSEPYDLTYGEWSAKWWQWALSFPTNTNPMLDTTGQDAALGQSGPVWFLAGTMGALPSVERAATVPAGKSLFFPVLNYVVVSTPGDPPWNDPFLDTSVTPPVQYPSLGAYYRALAKANMDAVAGMGCDIDGWHVQDIQAFRCTSPEFMVNMPDGNIWSQYGLAGGTYGPSVSDGYFLMVAPLAPGPHKIHFQGGASDGSWSVDVIYHLTVTPR